MASFEAEAWSFLAGQPLGIAGLVVFIAGLVRRWWVMGWQYDRREAELLARVTEEREERMRWRATALRGTGLLEEFAKAITTRNVVP